MTQEELLLLRQEVTEKLDDAKEFKPFKSTDIRIANYLEQLDKVSDDNLKYIYLSLLKASMNFKPELTHKKNKENYNAVRDSLAEEYGVSKSLISRRYTEVYRFLLNEVRKEQKQQTQEFINKCYDEQGNLSLVNIANAFELDVLELRDALIDYSRSLTLKEYEIAMEFGFSLEAEKVCNINLIATRIKELEDCKELPKYPSKLFIRDRERQLDNFLWSVNSIMEDYRNKQEEKAKTYSK